MQLLLGFQLKQSSQIEVMTFKNDSKTTISSETIMCGKLWISNNLKKLNFADFVPRKCI